MVLGLLPLLSLSTQNIKSKGEILTHPSDSSE